MELENLPPIFEAYRAEYPELTVCRVVLQEKELYHVIYQDGMMQAQVSGKFRYDAKTASDFPAVGDYVMADITSGDRAVIHNVLPRTSVFVRKAAGKTITEQVIAANIDTVFLCMSLNLDFNLRRIERYLTAAWDSGAVPVVLLTKTDLCDDVATKIAEIERVAIGVDIITTSFAETDSYSQIVPYLKAGKTLAFVGSSGVGKSTLINHLLGEDRLETNGLRGDDKGRHTTTHRELLMLPCGAMVIDTPGMREMGMWDSGDGLSTAFEDIELLAEGCRFKNCTHHLEPGCAVQEAIQSGELSAERFSSYEKLKAENAYSDDAEGYLAAKEEKFKTIAKFNKANHKNRQ